MGHSLKTDPCEFLSTQNILRGSVSEFGSYFSQSLTRTILQQGKGQAAVRELKTISKGIKIAGMELGLKEHAELQSLW